MALEPLHRRGSPLIAQNEQAAEDTLIANSLFWPSISVGLFNTKYGVDGTYDVERQAHCLRQGMIAVNKELRVWSCQQVNDGYDTLADVPSDLLGEGTEAEVHEKTELYNNAVFSHAMALLEGRYWSSADTVGDDGRAQDAQWSADEYYTERWEAMQDLMDEPRCIVELL